MSVMIKAMTTCAVHKKGNCTQRNAGKGLGWQATQSRYMAILAYTQRESKDSIRKYAHISFKCIVCLSLLNKCTK